MPWPIFAAVTETTAGGVSSKWKRTKLKKLSRTDRDRAGLRVRLVRHPGLQDAQVGGVRGGPNQLNSAPITIDPDMANNAYIIPMTPDPLEQMLAKKRSDALLRTMGNQTAHNLARRLALASHNVELIGAKLESIKKAEDRDLFKQAMNNIGSRRRLRGVPFDHQTCLHIGWRDCYREIL